MRNFRQALLKYVAPKLKSLGYEYSPSLNYGNIRYCFTKQLSPHVKCFIEFERDIRRTGSGVKADGLNFTIRLKRINNKYKVSDSVWAEVEGELQLVVWKANNFSKTIKHPLMTWRAEDEIQLQSAFKKALIKLKRHGIPWLENETSKPFYVLSSRQRDEFLDAVTKIAGPKLKSDGYIYQKAFFTRYVVFSKQVAKKKWLFIAFELSIGSSAVEGYQKINVRLDQNSQRDFFDTSWRSETLPGLLWEEHGLVAANDDFVPDDVQKHRIDFPPYIKDWGFSTKKQLYQQLRSILKLITTYVIPYLESGTHDSLTLALKKKYPVQNG